MKRLGIPAVLLAAATLVVGAIALASSCGGLDASSARVSVPAPIDRVEVAIRESAPPQVTLKIAAGLPSGCAQRESHVLSRSGDAFTVTVLNSMPRGDQACTMIYGTYELTIDLKGEFRSGVTYTVQVNDKTTTFKT